MEPLDRPLVMSWDRVAEYGAMVCNLKRSLQLSLASYVAAEIQCRRSDVYVFGDA